MAEKGVLFDVTFGELCAGATAGCHLFNWIMDDEWISREAIHGVARRDMIIDDPNHKLGWAFRDSSLWLDEWLPKPCPENTLHKIRASLGGSLNQCCLWASTYQRPVHFGQVCKPSECVAEMLRCETEPVNETAPYGLIREGSGRLVLAARTAVGRSLGAMSGTNCPARDWFFGGALQRGKHTPRSDDSPFTATVKDLFAEHVKDGQSAEVEFDWFADEPKVIEII
ncbi:hypothetical protein F4824DRAFT_494559 [Ustulina deusta]|nr:hypothetical protein F4823DRAFT_560621 [Ustulina deusta]KAI3342758.1 hypothetical protein F4824DRAFT_494559 [Ustulina deusta]